MVNALLAVAALVACVSTVQAQIEISYPGVGRPESPGGWLFSWEGGIPPYSAAMIDYDDSSLVYNSTTFTVDNSFTFQCNAPVGASVKYYVEDALGNYQEKGPFVVVASVSAQYPAYPAVGVESQFLWKNGIAPYHLVVYASDSTTVLHTSPNITESDASYTWDFSGAGLTEGDTVYFQMCDSQLECAQSKAVYILDASAVQSISQSQASTRTGAAGSSTATHTHGSSSAGSTAGKKAPIGAIVGGVVGGIVVLGALAGFGVWLILRKRAARARAAAAAASNVNPATFSHDSGESGLKDSGSAIVSPYSPAMTQTAPPTTASFTTGGMYSTPSSAAPMSVNYAAPNAAYSAPAAAAAPAMGYYSPQSPQSPQRQSMLLSPSQAASSRPVSPSFHSAQQNSGPPTPLPAGMHTNYTGVPEVQ